MQIKPHAARDAMRLASRAGPKDHGKAAWVAVHLHRLGHLPAVPVRWLSCGKVRRLLCAVAAKQPAESRSRSRSSLCAQVEAVGCERGCTLYSAWGSMGSHVRPLGVGLAADSSSCRGLCRVAGGVDGLVGQPQGSHGSAQRPRSLSPCKLSAFTRPAKCRDSSARRAK